MTDIDVEMEKISPVTDQSNNNIEISLQKQNLTKNYNDLEQRIAEHFENLKTAVDLRKNVMIKELNGRLIVKQNFLNSYLTNEKENTNNKLQIKNRLKHFVDNDKLELLTHKYFSKEDPSLIELSSIIKSHGQLIELNKDSTELIDETRIFSNEQIESQLDGSGLKQCYINEKSKFTLTFKNKDNNIAFLKSNVSFLDIFIVTSGETTLAAKSNFQTSKLTHNDKNNIGIKKRLTSNSSTNSLATPRSDNIKRCKCDCTLECIAEGVYVIHYKLDRKGLYLLNVLVNKSHVGDSPYKLKCLENSQKVPDSNLRMKRTSIKTQSALNITSNTTKNQSNNIPHSMTSDDLKKTSSKSISRINSMSQLANISNTIKKKIPVSALSNSTNNNIGHNIGFNFAHGATTIKSHTCSHDSKNQSFKKSDEDILLNLMPSPTLSVRSSGPNSLKMNRSFKEDDFLFHIGSKGRNVAEFLNPQAVCATHEHIYISDSSNQKVDVFAHNGEFKFTLGGNSTNTNKRIRRPIGIDSTLDQKILVVDYEFKCVNVFEENGKFCSRICQGKLLGPKGICVNRHDKNQIIIADSKSNSVCIFDAEGKFQFRFGNLGNKNENFAGPQYVTCMSNGDIAITDFYNHCIKIFDAHGQFRFSFGQNGLQQGQFNGPTGITTDKDDNIIVVDWGNSRIQVFDKHGSFIRYINSESNQLYGPQAIAIINNTIAVADTGNHCVKIFEYS